MNTLMGTVFVILFCIHLPVECAKILSLFAAPSISHQVVFRRFSEELYKRGHELVIITPLPVYSDKKRENFTEIDIHDVVSDVWKRAVNTMSTATKRDLNKQKKTFVNIGTQLLSAILSTKGVREIINYESNKFDLIFIESGSNIALLFSHILKAPVIIMSSLGAHIDNFEVFGGTVHPFLYPPGMCRRCYSLTVWDKINELYDYYWFKYIIMKQITEEDHILKARNDENTPTVKEMCDNADSLFLNIHRLWEGNRPVPLSVLYLGGMHQVPENGLPQELKSYLDASKNGVIYMSFGTNVSPSLLAPEKLQIFINVFSKLPYDVIWKLDEDDIPGRPDNVKVIKWVPQADLLRSPKIKLFITQGGLQSTDESITAGVPFIGIPMLGDQWYMAEKYVQHKIGIKLDYDSLTEEEFKESIETVIRDESNTAASELNLQFEIMAFSTLLWTCCINRRGGKALTTLFVYYRENVVKLRTILYDQPQTSLERAVWWTEYVLRHGGAKHLRGPAANISWAEYIELNLMLTLLFVLFIIISVLLYITYLFFRIVRKFITLKLKKA